MKKHTWREVTLVVSSQCVSVLPHFTSSHHQSSYLVTKHRLNLPAGS